jgi:thiosulfate reductase/polysulfide reductase chain A
LVEGAWALLGTPQGAIRQKVRCSADLDPRVVVASAGWWFPERKDAELSGWKESNLNILTRNDPPYDPAIGTPILRGFPCRMWSDDAREKGEEEKKVP